MTDGLLDFELGDGKTARVPRKDIVVRTTISPTIPVTLDQYPKKVAARVVLFLRTGTVSVRGLSLQEFGYLVYLADRMGIEEIVERIQLKYDSYQPATEEEFQCGLEMLNIASVAPSIDPQQLFEKIPIHTNLAALWPGALARLYKNFPPPISLTDEKRLLQDLFNWISRVQPTVKALWNVLDSLPKIGRIRQSFPFPYQDGPVDAGAEEMYFVNILGSRYEETWNQWLEAKAREDREKMLYGLEKGANMREHSLPDSLYQSAISRRPLHVPEPLPVSPPVREENPMNQVVALPVRPKKMDILKRALKASFIKLRNRLVRHQ